MIDDDDDDDDGGICWFLMGRIYISDFLKLYFHSKCVLYIQFYQNNLAQHFYFFQPFLELLFMFLLGVILSLTNDKSFVFLYRVKYKIALYLHKHIEIK